MCARRLTFCREDEDLAQREAGFDADHLDEDEASLDRVSAGQVLGGSVIQGPGEPGAQAVSRDAGRVSHSDLQVMEGRVAAAAASQDADHLDVVRLQQVYHPPGGGFALGFRAVLVLVDDGAVTVVAVARLSSANRRGLVRRLPVRHVDR